MTGVYTRRPGFKPGTWASTGSVLSLEILQPWLSKPLVAKVPKASPAGASYIDNGVSLEGHAPCSTVRPTMSSPTRPWDSKVSHGRPWQEGKSEALAEGFVHTPAIASARRVQSDLKIGRTPTVHVQRARKTENRKQMRKWRTVDHQCGGDEGTADFVVFQSVQSRSLGAKMDGGAGGGSPPLPGPFPWDRFHGSSRHCHHGG
jgi:hypothetical protein